MSGRAWHSIHYNFNNYRDVLPSSTSPSEEPSTLCLLELEARVELMLCVVFFSEELGVDFPLPRLLLDRLLDLDFPLDTCLVWTRKFVDTFDTRISTCSTSLWRLFVT